MSTNDDEQTSSLERTFAVMLAELEDAATALTVEHDRLIQEADKVAAELDRVETVRSAMLNKPKPAKRTRAAREGREAAPPRAASRAAEESRERVRKIVEYAKTTGGQVTGREAADATGMAFQGIGPVLAGMVRRGEATVAEPDGDGPRVYTIVGATE